MSDEYISEDEFWEDWGVIQKFDGVLFEYDDVRCQPIHHVWTIVESGSNENDSWYASPGFHYVNRMGYVKTEKPWADDRRDAVYFLNDSNFEANDDA